MENLELWQSTADALEIPLEELLAQVSYETAGSMSPTQAGPTTKWGQHQGLIQFGEPQAEKYGVDFSSNEAALNSQLGEDGAIVQYMLDHGYVPGEHNAMDFYSTINAGAPGRYGASDTVAGGAPGDVRDKFTNQMGGHRAAAQRMMGIEGGIPTNMGVGPTTARAETGLPLSIRQPEPEPTEEEEPSWFDETGLGQWRSNTLAPMQAKARAGLGMSDEGGEKFGNALMTLGQQMMGGFA